MENSDYLDSRILEEISLSIRCDAANESFFERLCKVVAKESCRLVPKVNGRKLKPEDFELIKDSKVGRSVYAKLHSRKSGKAKCRISLGSPKNMIPEEELVDENFEGCCILKLYHAYLGSTRSITLTVEEILVKEMNTMESYFDGESDSESDDESSRIHYILTRDYSC